MYAHCDRKGVITLHQKADVTGLICIGKDSKRNLEHKMQARARLARDGTTWLVPGVPESDGDNDAITALIEFQKRFNKPLTN